MTPAGNLVRAFGKVDEMAALYAPEVSWRLPPSAMFPEPIRGRDAVIAFNRQVWTQFYDRDCEVEILDEIGDDRTSAVRFIYRAFAKLANRAYENEYTVFVRSDEQGISEVFELFDSAIAAKLYQSS